jgi:hypothetical protein
MLAGCSSQAGKLSVVSTTLTDVQLDSRYQTVIYSRQESGLVTAVLIDGPIEAPRQVVTIRTIWTPWAGRTPVDADATNATIQYVIYAGPDRQIAGVYSGAGYVYLYDNAGRSTVDFGIWQSNLILVDSTVGFQDRIGQANMTGEFSARRDDARTLTLIRTMSEEISSTLGYPRVVERAPTAPACSQAINTTMCSTSIAIDPQSSTQAAIALKH